MKLTDAATTDRSARAVVIVRSAVWGTVLGAVLVLLGGAVGRVVVFGSGSAVQRAALRVDARVATLLDRKRNYGNCVIVDAKMAYAATRTY